MSTDPYADAFGFCLGRDEPADTCGCEHHRKNKPALPSARRPPGRWFDALSHADQGKVTRFEAWARRADGGGLGIGTAKDYRGYVAKLRVITEAEFAALPEAERSDTRSGYRCYKRYVAAHPEDWLSGWDDPGLRPDDWADP